MKIQMSYDQPFFKFNVKESVQVWTKMPIFDKE